MSKFDLNINQVLENWEVFHAVREIISNALDEQKITETEEVKIIENPDGSWMIRDYGRGIDIEHFTQSENEEKLSHPNLIGRFGVGLKDALATFERNDIIVKIESKNGVFTLDRYHKSGFENIETLHVNIDESKEENFVGTLVTLVGCNGKDIEKAKSLFIDLSDLKLLEETEYGEIYPTILGNSSIYINGVKVAEEENFMFSYNITLLTAKIKKSLNRERTNVGRTAYTDRIKSILLNAKNDRVLEQLVENMNRVDPFEMKDELKWADVSIHAIKMLNLSRKYIFMSHYEMKEMNGNKRDIIRSSGKKIITVSDNVLNRLQDEYDEEGESIATVDIFMEDYVLGFQYKFIDENNLSKKEKDILLYKEIVCNHFNAKEYIKKIYISETIRPTVYGDDARGEYNSTEDIIIVRKDQLSSLEYFLGTLIHELVHAKTGLPDVNRKFEITLTEIIGDLASNVFIKEKDGKST